MSEQSGRPSGVPGDAIVVATVGRPHGVRGEMRLIPASGDPTRLAGLREAWLAAADGLATARRLAIRGMRVHGDVALATLQGVEDRDEAAALVHAEVWAREGDLPELGPDQFAVDDVVGMELWNEDRPVGRVTDVIAVSDRDYFEVETAGAGAPRRVLVPAVRDWLVRLDHEAGRVVLRLPEGLLDV